MVVVSELGHVEGEVHAAHLVVSGRITGPVHVTELLELQPKARVTGDVHYRAIEIHQGAVVEGRLIYQASERSNKGAGNVEIGRRRRHFRELRRARTPIIAAVSSGKHRLEFPQ